MAYNQELARRVLQRVGALPGMTEKKMFGGVGYILNGNMACGVHGERLIVRLDPAEHQATLAQPHTAPFDTMGKAMPGWVLVGPEGLEDDADLYGWIERGLAYARSLPPK